MGRIWRKKNVGQKVDAQSYYVELEKLTPLQELNIKSDPEHYGRKNSQGTKKRTKACKEKTNWVPYLSNCRN